jgi:predicted MFS family arabinose efflux permease
MKNKWVLLAILYLSAITVSLGQLKIVPIMGQVAELAGVSIPQAGLLVSIFTLAGIILAIPGGKILAKIGSKNLLLFLIGMLSAGNVLGALTNNFPLLLLSRIIEGTAFSMIIMNGLVMINGWFEGGNGTNTAIGIFTTFPAVASFVGMNVTLPIVMKLGIKSVWWIIAALAAVFFLMILTLVPPPKTSEREEKSGERPSLTTAAKNYRVWLLAFSHLCIAFVLFTYITCYPALFTGFYGLDQGTANSYNGLNGLFGIPACVFCGILIDKVKKPYTIALVGRIGTIITVAVNLLLGPSTFVLHLALVALLIGGIGITSDLCIGPTLAKSSSYIGYSMSFINLLYYVGVFASTPLTLWLVETSGWGAATTLLIIVSIVATVLAGILALPQKSPVKGTAN